MTRRILAVLIAGSMFLAACGIDSATAVPSPQDPNRPDAASTAAKPSPQAEAPAATDELSPSGSLGPERIEFAAEDGTALVGTFWPSPDDGAPAPGILLMHWNPGSREDWNMLATLLQGAAVSSQQANQQGYAVFAFDFRGHGESGGSADRAGYLMDARAALDRFRTLPGVDPNWIIAIGASIGADAAVDACGEGCVGAVSLSPGAFLGIPYPDAVAAVGNKPVLCVAAQGDGPSPGACREGQAAAQGDYQLQIYQGSAHAMQMFDITEEEPALVDLIFQWLDAHVLPA